MSFTDVSANAGIELPGVPTESLAWGDYDGDGDGDLDLCVSSSASNKLWRNDAASTSHWLELRLVGVTSNRSAIGARVELAAGVARRVHEVGGGAGRRSGNFLPLELGLGGATSADRLIIRWPDGSLQVFDGVTADQVLVAPPCLALLASPLVVARMLSGVPRLIEEPVMRRESWSSVSLVVPARSELASLEAATRSRLGLRYPDLQLLLVDDRSDDGSSELVDRLAARDERVAAVHETKLPEGWVGKNHALQQGVARARGEWLLFSDADVHLSLDALTRAVDHALRRRLDMLAVLPDLTGGGFLLDAAVAGFGRLFAISQRPWAVADPNSKAAMGVGAFNLVRRAALERSERLPWLAAFGLLVGTGSVAVIARRISRPLLPTLLTPPGSLLMIFIFLRSGWLGWRRSGVHWRGMFYPSERLRKRGRVRF